MEIDMMVTTILIISPPAVLWFVLSCNKAIYIAANPDPGAKNNFSMTVVIKMMMMVTVVIKMMMMVLACSWSILGHQVFPQLNILAFSQRLCQTIFFNSRIYLQSKFSTGTHIIYIYVYSQCIIWGGRGFVVFRNAEEFPKKQRLTRLRDFEKCLLPIKRW